MSRKYRYSIRITLLKVLWYIGQRIYRVVLINTVSHSAHRLADCITGCIYRTTEVQELRNVI